MFPYAPQQNAPKNLQQTINPWNWWASMTSSDNQNGLINITNYKTGDSATEQRITGEVAGYGMQLDVIEHALSAVIELLPKKDITDIQKQHISAFTDMLARIEHEKNKKREEEFSAGGVDRLVEQLHLLKEQQPELYNTVATRLKAAL